MQDLPAFVQIHTYFDNSVGQSTTVHCSTNHIKYGDYDIIYEQFPSFPCRPQLQDCMQYCARLQLVTRQGRDGLRGDIVTKSGPSVSSLSQKHE